MLPERRKPGGPRRKWQDGIRRAICARVICVRKTVIIEHDEEEVWKTDSGARRYNISYDSRAWRHNHTTISINATNSSCVLNLPCFFFAMDWCFSAVSWVARSRTQVNIIKPVKNIMFSSFCYVPRRVSLYFIHDAIETVYDIIYVMLAKFIMKSLFI